MNSQANGLFFEGDILHGRDATHLINGAAIDPTQLPLQFCYDILSRYTDDIDTVLNLCARFCPSNLPLY